MDVLNESELRQLAAVVLAEPISESSPQPPSVMTEEEWLAAIDEGLADVAAGRVIPIE